MFDYSIGAMELVKPDGSTETLPVSGPTTVAVYFEGASEGTANDSDGDGRDEVSTEMVALELTGLSPALGPIRVSLHPSLPARGQLEEVANNVPGVLDLPPFVITGTADSFFDIFFQIEVGGQTFYTVAPKRMSSRITHKPPGPTDRYENPDRIPLVTGSGQPTGYYLGATRHTPQPPVEIDVFDYHDREQDRAHLAICRE